MVTAEELACPEGKLFLVSMSKFWQFTVFAAVAKRN